MVPRFVIPIVMKEGGYQPVVTLKEEFVYRDEPCPDVRSARIVGAEFVVGRPEEEREIVWAQDEPLWVGGQEVGRISIEPFEAGGFDTTGWIRLTDETSVIKTLMAEHAGWSRHWRAGPDRDAAESRYKATEGVVTKLGLAFGKPPRSMVHFAFVGDSHMDFDIGEAWVPDIEPSESG